MHDPLLRVLICHGGDSTAADAALARVAATLRQEGVRLGGALQRSGPRTDRPHPDMILEDLASGRMVTISEDRGPEATGCRLDIVALEEVVGLATVALESGAELLIINRYGKREAEGHGFRQAIEAAVARGVPVLLAVGDEYVQHWREFAAGLDVEVAPDATALTDWSLTAIAASRRAASKVES